MDNKQAILELLNSVKRRNMYILIKWIEEDTDFFTAPASSKFHGNYKGGLAEHCMDTYQCFLQLMETPQFKKYDFPMESVILITLLHDMCKTNFYFETTRNWKNPDTGQWEQVPYYEIVDSHPYGHGECSVMLISDYIKLTTEEKYAIRWHQGGFDKLVQAGDFTVNRVFEVSPISVCLHIADMMATYTCNRKQEK